MTPSDRQTTTKVVLGTIVMFLLLAGLYTAAYAWRWQQVRFVIDFSRGWGSEWTPHPRFATRFEEVLFVPALWVHRRLDPQAFDPEGVIEFETGHSSR